MDCSSPGDFLGKKSGMGSYSILQGIFPTLGSNLGLPHCRWVPYRLSHQWSPISLQMLLTCVLRYICFSPVSGSCSSVLALLIWSRFLLLPGITWILVKEHLLNANSSTYTQGSWRLHPKRAEPCNLALSVPLRGFSYFPLLTPANDQYLLNVALW